MKHTVVVITCAVYRAIPQVQTDEYRKRTDQEDSRTHRETDEQRHNRRTDTMRGEHALATTDTVDCRLSVAVSPTTAAVAGPALHADCTLQSSRQIARTRTRRRAVCSLVLVISHRSFYPPSSCRQHRIVRFGVKQGSAASHTTSSVASVCVTAYDLKNSFIFEKT